MLERLHKVLARAGVAALRPAEDMIMAGQVTVNGRVVRELGARVDPETDVIAVDGAVVELRQPSDPYHYVIVHKPVGVISTAQDTHGRPTVVGLVPSNERLFPVGRLDADSEGLLLLTDDGDLAYRLTHPRFEVEKEYRVLLDRPPTVEDLRRWREGVELEGELTMPAWVEVLERTEDGVWVRIVMREGRKRQIREVARLLGYQVRRLIRVREGPISLGDLRPGEWRELTAGEVQTLRAHTQHIPSRAEEEREYRMPERERPEGRRLRVIRGTRRPMSRDDERVAQPQFLIEQEPGPATPPRRARAYDQPAAEASSARDEERSFGTRQPRFEARDTPPNERQRRPSYSDQPRRQGDSPQPRGGAPERRGADSGNRSAQRRDQRRPYDDRGAQRPYDDRGAARRTADYSPAPRGNQRRPEYDDDQRGNQRSYVNRGNQGPDNERRGPAGTGSRDYGNEREYDNARSDRPRSFERGSNASGRSDYRAGRPDRGRDASDRPNAGPQPAGRPRGGPRDRQEGSFADRQRRSYDDRSSGRGGYDPQRGGTGRRPEGSRDDRGEPSRSRGEYGRAPDARRPGGERGYSPQRPGRSGPRSFGNDRQDEGNEPRRGDIRSGLGQNRGGSGRGSQGQSGTSRGGFGGGTSGSASRGGPSRGGPGGPSRGGPGGRPGGPSRGGPGGFSRGGSEGRPGGPSRGGPGGFSRGGSEGRPGGPSRGGFSRGGPGRRPGGPSRGGPPGRRRRDEE